MAKFCLYLIAKCLALYKLVMCVSVCDFENQHLCRTLCAVNVLSFDKFLLQCIICMNEKERKMRQEDRMGILVSKHSDGLCDVEYGIREVLVENLTLHII